MFVMSCCSQIGLKSTRQFTTSCTAEKSVVLLFPDGASVSCPLCTVPEYDMRRILPKNGDYKICMFLSDGSGSPIQELDHNGTFLRKENQSSKLNYIYQYPV